MAALMAADLGPRGCHSSDCFSIGGGASDVRQGGDRSADRVVVGAGGGGTTGTTLGGNGGAGGGDMGGSGGNGQGEFAAIGGTGGTQSTGGTAGAVPEATSGRRATAQVATEAGAEAHPSPRAAQRTCG